MNIDHLKYLIAVEKYGSISKAAKALYLNQPYLSKVVSEVEEELNIKIFDRSHQGVRVTYRGREALDRIARIVDETDALENLYQNEAEKPFRFSVAVPTASYIAHAFKDYTLSKSPFVSGCSIGYNETDTTDAINLVSEGECDIAVVRIFDFDKDYYADRLETKRLNIERIAHFSLVALMSENNPLALKETFAAAEMKESVVILHGDIRLPRHTIFHIKGIIQSAGFRSTIKVYERASQLELLEAIENSLMWVSPMPKQQLEKYHLVTRTCRDFDLQAGDYLISRRNHTLTREEREFIDILRQAAKAFENKA